MRTCRRFSRSFSGFEPSRTSLREDTASRRRLAETPISTKRGASTERHRRQKSDLSRVEACTRRDYSFRTGETGLREGGGPPQGREPAHGVARSLGPRAEFGKDAALALERRRAAGARGLTKVVIVARSRSRVDGVQRVRSVTVSDNVSSVLQHTKSKKRRASGGLQPRSCMNRHSTLFK